MSTNYTFTDINLSEYRGIAEQRCGGGWRYVQSFCTNTDNGIDFTVTFCKDDVMDNFRIRAIQKTDTVPSISDLYFSAFVFENEAHDLFGLNISNIVIDFKGHFYDLAQETPMTIISPEQKAAREKAAKIAAAKAAKETKAAKAAKEAKAAGGGDSSGAAAKSDLGGTPAKNEQPATKESAGE